jgi:2-hydroxycyclohexanecarboxyl-CoA dehydrogenase
MPGFRGLAGQAALVTGAASGIGLAIAKRLAEENVFVGVLDRDAAGAEAAVKELERGGGRALALPADITDAARVEAALGRFVAAAGRLDALVNNAGWDRAAPFAETDAALWRQVVEINLLGPLHVTKAALAHLVARGRGRIVSIASDAGRVGSSGEAVYSACKGGIIAFSKSLARELAKTGVTVNAIAPGPTDTPLFASFDPEGGLARALARAIPMGRLGQPGDYPGLVAFLLSDDAAFITGQVISVSGGLTMS